MYPENPEGTQVIVGSMNMGYISDTARNRTHNLFHPKRESIPLGHSGIITKESCKWIEFISVVLLHQITEIVAKHSRLKTLETQVSRLHWRLELEATTLIICMPQFQLSCSAALVPKFTSWDQGWRLKSALRLQSNFMIQCYLRLQDLHPCITGNNNNSNNLRQMFHC